VTTEADSLGAAGLSTLERVRRRPDLSRRALAARAGAVLLWLVVLSSAASGFLALARVRSAGPDPTAPVPPGLEGFAELHVSSHLEGPPAEGRDEGVIRPGDRYVVRAATVAVEAAEEAGSWSATVAAEVLIAGDGGYRRDGTHYFRVDVERRGDGYMATSSPEEVSPPGSAAPGRR
jgi:hypothetical protein